MRLLITVLQVALGIFHADPDKAAGNLGGYFAQDTLYSEAPKGYKPFYISHIARHGSRFLDPENAGCFQAIDTLALYAGKGLLTDEGYSLMEDLKVMKNLSEGNYGALTELGASEHRTICNRMVRHYPEVFSNPKRTRAVAFATSSSRVMASMNAFLGELSDMAPGMEIESHKTNWGEDTLSQEVSGYYFLEKDETKALRKLKSRQLRHSIKSITKPYDNFSAFARRIFNNPDSIPSSSAKNLARSTYQAFKTGRISYPETLPGMSRYLTPEELFYLWSSGSTSWISFTATRDYVSPMVKLRGNGILKRIIADADEAINSKSTTAATLRFSHDTFLLPLMGAIPLEGAVMDCEEKDYLDKFQDFNVICTACNVQLIFYKNKKGHVLVKFLLNEKETPILGLAPKTGLYYDWDTVKEFWAHRMVI